MDNQKNQKNKVLVLLRGLPGSGKSHLSSSLSKGGIILSTDDFWMDNGEYKFDPARIGEAHVWNQKRALKAFQSGISPIVIDNVNSKAWEVKPYYLFAKHYGYEVKVEEPNTPWKFNVEELARRNKHHVPKERIEEFIADWEHNIGAEDIDHSEVPQGISYVDSSGNIIQE